MSAQACEESRNRFCRAMFRRTLDFRASARAQDHKIGTYSRGIVDSETTQAEKVNYEAKN